MNFDKKKDDYELLYKILLIGDTAVGKTSLINRFTDDSFNETFISTIGVDFKVKTVAIDGKIAKLQIWDTAGQERFRTITSSYYRGSQGVVLVYDVTNEESFNNIELWLSEVEIHAGKDVSKILIGNKTDLKHQRVVPCEKALKLANKYQMYYVETSAKDSENVETSFISLANLIKLKYRNQSVNVNKIEERLFYGDNKIIKLLDHDKIDEQCCL